jgi:ATP-binding cassette subfamily B protein
MARSWRRGWSEFWSSSWRRKKPTLEVAESELVDLEKLVNRGRTEPPSSLSTNNVRHILASVAPFELERLQALQALGWLMKPFLWPSQWRIRFFVVLSFCLTLAGKLLTVLAPVALKRVIDALSAPSTVTTTASVHTAVTYTVLYATSRFGVQLLSDAQRYAWLTVSQAATRAIALTTFTHLHTLSVDFHWQRRTGEVIRVMDRGVASLGEVLSVFVFTLLPTAVELFLVLWVFFAMGSLWIAITVFASVVIYALYSKQVTEWRTIHRKHYNERDNAAEARMVDSLLNYETVKLFTAEAREVQRYADAYMALQESERTLQATLGLLNSGQSVIISLGVGISMVMATRRVASGAMSAGDLVMVNAYILQLYQPLRWLGSAYRQIMKALTDLDKLSKLLAVEPTVRDVPGALPLRCTHGSVEFRNVTFRYETLPMTTDGSSGPTGYPALAAAGGVHDLSFAIPARRVVAVVGPSGAGKTTIIRLLLRLIEPQYGTISIDGQDLAHVQQQSVRQVIGVVAQDPVLFNETIAYNIAYGVEPSVATTKAIEEAARAAHIHDFIASLPDGYATIVGERGVRLSGGEKQRVAIARAILKNPSILVLDEATSALDTATERMIQANLMEMRAGRTTLVVAHRLSTVVDADEILVLNKMGEMVERGAHADLISQKSGAYYAMWEAQARVHANLKEPITPNVSSSTHVGGAHGAGSVGGPTAHVHGTRLPYGH